MRSRGQALVAGLASLVLAACSGDDSKGVGGAGGPSREQPKPAGSAASETPPREIGARAIATLEALRPGESEEDASGVSGNAMFSQTAESVTMATMLRRCRRDAKPYEMFVKQGVDCSTETLAGRNWDGARGEGLQAVQCDTTLLARGFYRRLNDDQKPWSIGAPAASDLLGHALVVVDVDSGTPVACGIIVREQTNSPTASVSPEDLEQLAPVAGVCLRRTIARANMNQCEDSAALVECASAHCDLLSCRRVCADYTACIAVAEDPCAAAFQCPLAEPCSTCQTRVQNCVASFCLDELVCAAPVTPGGPCGKLAECCAKQGAGEGSCLETVKLLEKLGGDPSCAGAMGNWDFSKYLAVPCTFD